MLDWISVVCLLINKVMVSTKITEDLYESKLIICQLVNKFSGFHEGQTFIVTCPRAYLSPSSVCPSRFPN